MAAKEAAYGQPRSAQDAVLLQRKPRVLGAGRREPAGARQQGRDEVLIRRDRPDRDAGGAGHGREPGIAASASPSSLVSVANGARSDAGRPMITRAAWGARHAVRLAQPPPRAVTLDGTADLTAHGEAGSARLGRRAPEHDHGRPVNSFAPLEERLDSGAGGQPFATWKAACQTVSRFRPFARRRLRTLRPPLVFIRSRNPWVFFRRRTLG